jgi:hypothetical protein
MSINEFKVFIDWAVNLLSSIEEDRGVLVNDLFNPFPLLQCVINRYYLFSAVEPVLYF